MEDEDEEEDEERRLLLKITALSFNASTLDFSFLVSMQHWR